MYHDWQLQALQTAKDRNCGFQSQPCNTPRCSLTACRGTFVPALQDFEKHWTQSGLGTDGSLRDILIHNWYQPSATLPTIAPDRSRKHFDTNATAAQFSTEILWKRRQVLRWNLDIGLVGHVES